MKRLMIVLAALLIFSGCAASQEDPFRVDTVVQIPVDPTDAPTEPATEEPTEAPTEAATEAPTEPKETTAQKTTASSKSSSSTKTSTSSKSTSSSKTSSSSSSSSSKNQSTSKKEPAATQPPVTIPPETVPVATIPTEAPTEPPTEPPTEAPTEPPYDPSSYGVGGLEYAIVEELNTYRVAEGLPELSLSGRLSGIAYIRAQEISISWSHTRPDGRSYTSAMGDYGYGYGAASEHLVYVSGDGDGAAIAAKWMSSDSNSADILSGSFAKAGVGVYRAGGMTYVACLLIG